MTTLLSLLVLLGLGVPGPAAALSFESFGVSAFITPPGQGGASFTITTPDFVLGGGFPRFNNVPGLSGSGAFGCEGPGFDDFHGLRCRPGDSVSASVRGNGGDESVANLSRAGQFIPHCTLTPGPFTGEGDLCLEAVGRLGWSAALLPPFTGATEITVAGTFGADIGISILQIGPVPGVPGGFFRVIDGAEFAGSGSALFDLIWEPDTNTWLPLFAEGRIDPTPEPATLLLFVTTGAGLGLRWYRRRPAKQQHGGIAAQMI